MLYYLKVLARALKMHLLRWNRYRVDVIVWLVSIWLTVGIQVLLAHIMFTATGGHFFGYSEKELFGFFGVALFASGIAQSTATGLILNLSNAIWQGEFDHWLLQPPPIGLRMMTEDLGLVWYWPHLIAGLILMAWSFPVGVLPIAIFSGLIASTIEIGLIFILCVPALKWGRWNPNQGLWEYFESARSIPTGRSRNFMLWFVSFGVLQYSLALEVITGKLSILLLIAVSILINLLAWLLLRLFITSYSSASS